MGEERAQGSIAKLFRYGPQAAPDQLIALNLGVEEMRLGAALPRDEPFGLQPLEQLLHGGVMRLGPPGIQDFRDLTNRGGPLAPEHLEDRELGVGDLLRGTSHRDSLISGKERPL